MDQTIDELLRGPDKLEHIYVHRKNRDYVIATLFRNNENGVIECQCSNSDNGLNRVPALTGILAQDALPKTANNIYVAASNLSKYLSKNGYKSVTTIIQTKNGVKLR
ncbi:hypothetical protein [Mucilaginibacter sp.]|uniref:hypothetical protein n=1 Tax=Mucilaginibacter sp. TaxID=1882438 RepID=UPI003D133A37